MSGTAGLSLGHKRPVIPFGNLKLESGHFGKQVTDLKPGTARVRQSLSEHLPEEGRARNCQRWCTGEIFTQGMCSNVSLRIEDPPPALLVRIQHATLCRFTGYSGASQPTGT